VSARSIGVWQLVAADPLASMRAAVEEPTFLAGVAWGLTALVVVVPVALVARRFRSGGPPPLAGLALAVATLLALRADERLAPGLLVALLVLFAGGLLARRVPSRGIVAAVFAVPGALLLVRATPAASGEGWIGPVVAVATVVAAFSLGRFDRRWSRAGLAPVLVAITAAGIFGAVPDTEEALALLGAALPLALLGWPLPFASLGVGGAHAVAGIVLWTVASGGIGRPASIVGGIACLGLLMVEPLVRVLGNRTTILERLPRRRTAIAAAVGLHLAIVLVASRLAGVRSGVVAATVIGVGALGAGAVVLVRGSAVAVSRDPRRPSLGRSVGGR
jgi:hypothetical protein